MNTINIKCQACGTTIELTKTLAAPLLESQKQEFEKTVAKQEKAQREREEAIKQREERLSQTEKEVTKRVQSELEKIKAEQNQESEKKYSQQISMLEQQVKSQHKDYLAIQKSELESRQARDAAVRAKESAELEIQRQVDQRITAERADATTKANESAAKEIAKQANVLETLRTQISDMERKASPTAAHIHGDIQEENVFGKLRMEFPQDSFDRVTTGTRGADIIQRVMQPNRRIAGTILVEVKNTQNWDNNWLVKLKDDQRVAGADIPVIVSRAMPNGVTTFANIENVWVCAESVLLPMINCLRSGILGVAKEKAAFMVTTDRKEQIFEYLKGNAFSMRIQSILESYEAMRTELDRERQSQNNYWAKRERSLNRMVQGISGLSGDFQELGGPDVLKEDTEKQLEQLNTTAKALGNQQTKTLPSPAVSDSSTMHPNGSTDVAIDSPHDESILKPGRATSSDHEVFVAAPIEEPTSNNTTTEYKFTSIPTSDENIEQSMTVLQVLVSEGQEVIVGTTIVTAHDNNGTVRMVAATIKGKVQTISLQAGESLTEEEIQNAVTIAD